MVSNTIKTLNSELLDIPGLTIDQIQQINDIFNKHTKIKSSTTSIDFDIENYPGDSLPWPEKTKEELDNELCQYMKTRKSSKRRSKRKKFK